MKKQLLMIMVILITCGVVYSQNLIRVNNNPDIDADYTSLQDAVDNASNGDTIYMEGSVTEYTGADITKSVTIIGPGVFLSENPQTQANGFEAEFDFNNPISFKTGSEGSIITGCVCYDIDIYVDEITITRCNVNKVEIMSESKNILVLQNYIRDRIKNDSYTKFTNSVISNNIVQNYINFSSYSGFLQITNNVLKGSILYGYNSTIQNNILVSMSGAIGGQSNTINNNLFAGDGTNADGNQYNIDMSLVFKDLDGTKGFSTDGRWQLKTGSPAIGAGAGDIDCGAFGGVTSYVLSGIPALPHIYEATIPATANSADGLKVTIKVKTGN